MLIADSILIIILVLLDQWIKHAVVANIALGGQHPVINGVFSLTHLQNDGAAWSILQGQMWLFTVIALVALVVMGVFFWRYRNQREHWIEELGLALMMGGTIGNFIDRAFQGYVVDMFQLDFINFPIFNFADSCLTVGVILIMIGVFLADQREAHHGN
ncbi:lipoprotein signal peptidase [Levilactobacillus namurensis DSM 19117]|uniref:Lipoprotein signal peptidase n=1 Tax=Levilactobacillus namurensis DSM 19117 TaxID=1423773 RepID=A0A0R1KA19_9LACO|nr:signal peptidase II [Levilactobacillus namurensis]KRK77041.1 lipoprotein signal peptidase [Levilactobacillus namurensis DSM 19117]GEO74161.1 lipoprotein signal peptidase [Levilactobacillus namurensis]